MPTPVGHSIGGYVAGRLVDMEGRLSTRAAVILGVVLGNLPDFDFLPGLLVGVPAAYHRGMSHSIGAAVVVALGVAVVTRPILKVEFGPLFLVAFTVYASHLMLDAILPDTRGTAGVPLFWPVSDVYVGWALPVPWRVRYVLDLRIGTDVAGFFGILLRPRTFLALAVEAVLFLPLLALPRLVTRRGEERRQGKIPRSR